MALAGHVLYALIQTRVAQRNGGVAAVEELVDALAFFEPSQSAVLPQDGGGVGGGALQTVVTAAQRAVAQLQPLVKDLPELVDVAAGGQSHVRQVDGDHALIEAAIVLVLAGLIVSGVGNIAHSGVGEAVGGQEGAAAHAGVYVALQLLHLLFGNIVRHHALGGALGGQLR